MSLTRWSPLVSSLNRWPNIWDDDFDSLIPAASSNLDVYETDDEVVVKANVAGVSADKVDVTFEKGVLWIKAAAEETTDDKKKKHYSKSSWNYSYKVAVPGMIDYTREPAAEVSNGAITISFKKAEASKPKKLEVKQK
jgi:HSP20 family protein